MKLEFSAGGIIYKKSGESYKIGLILDSYGKWTFPKGHIEKGEKPEIAAKREIAEEVGLDDIQISALIDKIDYWFKFKGETFHKYVYYYLMEVPESAELTAQTSEIKDAQWFEPKKAQEILGYKKDSETLLKKAVKVLKNML